MITNTRKIANLNSILFKKKKTDYIYWPKLYGALEIQEKKATLQLINKPAFAQRHLA